MSKNESFDVINTNKSQKNLKWIKIVVASIGLLIVMILMLAYIPQPYYSDGFRTLSDLQKYAATLDEFIIMEGKNLANPSYESYYQKNVALTFGKRLYKNSYYLLSKLNMLSPPIFSISFFSSLLEDVRAKRLENGWSGDFVQKVVLTDSSKVIVFGAVQGAFHSLIRDLTKLKELQIIDENLKLRKSDYTLVFLGNAVNRSPFTLETFALVLRLIKNNPQNVIYLKGTNEYNQGWKVLTLKRELEIRAQHFSKEVIPLESSVNSFFNTLPLSIYSIMSLDDKNQVSYFQFSPSIDDEKLRNLLTESVDKQFLAEKTSERLDTLAISDFRINAKITGKVSLRAIVSDIKKRDMYEEMDGLRQLQFLQDHSNWTVMSCPTDPFLKAFNFSYDAFVLIEPGSANEWHITLYNRNIKNKENKEFSKRVYNLITGELLLE